jgi:hypothetical protein
MHLLTPYTFSHCDVGVVRLITNWVKVAQPWGRARSGAQGRAQRPSAPRRRRRGPRCPVPHKGTPPPLWPRAAKSLQLTLTHFRLTSPWSVRGSRAPHLAETMTNARGGQGRRGCPPRLGPEHLVLASSTSRPIPNKPAATALESPKRRLGTGFLGHEVGARTQKRHNPKLMADVHGGNAPARSSAGT